MLILKAFANFVLSFIFFGYKGLFAFCSKAVFYNKCYMMNIWNTGLKA